MEALHWWHLFLFWLQFMGVIRCGPVELEAPSLDYKTKLEAIAAQTSAFEDALENIPKLPEGHKQFQFYNIGPQGKLHKQWMSLQEVQNIILAFGMSRRSENRILGFENLPFYSNSILDHKGGALSIDSGVSPLQKSPKTSIEDVLANVQKVMSKEITKKLMKDDTEPQTPTSTSLPVIESTTLATSEVMPQNVTIPDTILAHLMEEQVKSLDTHSPWGIMTDNPGNELFGKVFDEDNSSAPTTTESSLDEDIIDVENFLADISPSVTTVGYDDSSTLRYLDYSTIKENYSELGNIEGSPQESLEIPPLKEDNSQPEAKKEATTVIENFDSSTPNENENDNSSFATQAIQTFLYKEMNNRTMDQSTDPTYIVIPAEDLHKSESDSLLNNEINEKYYTSSKKTSESLTTEESEAIATTIASDLVHSENPSDETLDPNETSTSVIEEASNMPLETTLPSKLELKDEIKFSQQSKNDTNEGIEATTISKFSLKTSSTAIPNFLQETDHEDGLKATKSNLQNLISQKSKIEVDSKVDSETLATSVLTPLEMAPLPNGNIETLGTLQDVDFTEYNEADYSPIYYEDLVEVDVNKGAVGVVANEDLNQSQDFDFPSPDAADSYHQPAHAVGAEESDLDADVDPTKFLPAHNPERFSGENPLRETPEGNLGLESTIQNLDPTIKGFVNQMNGIAFEVYKRAAKVHRRQNLVMSPLNLISSLAMLTLGARNTTADALNKLLGMDEFLVFNPHLVLQNVTNQVLGLNEEGHECAFVNNIFIEKMDSKTYPMDFFSRSMDFFYNASVEEVAFGEVGPTARDMANEKVRKQTSEAVQNFLKPKASLQVLGPLSLVSSSYFQGLWNIPIKERNLVDMNFIRFPSAERRLIRTVGISKRMNLRAGYSAELDATVAEVPLQSTSNEISLLLVMPGQQKRFIANGLSQLEQSLTTESWSKMLRIIILHELNFKMPIFSHRNYLNLSTILPDIGLQELFEESADFSGINGVKNLHLGDLVQLSEFHSCKLDLKMFASRSMKLNDVNTHEGGLEGGIHSSSLGKAEERSGPEEKDSHRPKRSDDSLSYDRAFFYVVRHNPTGLILFIGRYLDPETF